MDLIYLASPYSHKDKAVMVDRFNKACITAAALMAEGHAVFSPIAHSHPLADFMDEKLRTDFEFWMTQDLPLLNAASEMYVLTLEGWDKSRGVAREIQFCRDHGKPINFYAYDAWKVPA